MTWQYQQSTGELSHDGALRYTGYSGTGAGKNNPAMQNIHNIGPIPAGEYTIDEAHNDSVLGPCVMKLTPSPDNEMFGRADFFIHGDNADHDASHGCIIIGPITRNMISTSGDTELVVIS